MGRTENKILIKNNCRTEVWPMSGLFFFLFGLVLQRRQPRKRYIVIIVEGWEPAIRCGQRVSVRILFVFATLLLAFLIALTDTTARRLLRLDPIGDQQEDQCYHCYHNVFIKSKCNSIAWMNRCSSKVLSNKYLPVVNGFPKARDVCSRHARSKIDLDYFSLYIGLFSSGFIINMIYH